MSIVKFVIFFCLAFLLLLSCNSAPDSYLYGRWVLPQDKHEMIFSKDGKLSWIMPGYLINDTFYTKFKLDETVHPAHLDLYDFDKGILVDKILVGIIEKYGRDSAMIDFQAIDDWSQADSLRPKEFSNDHKRMILRQ